MGVRVGVAAWLVVGAVGAVVGCSTFDPSAGSQITHGTATAGVQVRFGERADLAGPPRRERPLDRLSTPILLPDPASVTARVVHPRVVSRPIPSFMGSVNSPQPATSFQALDDIDVRIPPDTHGAVGPNHVMTVLNSEVRIQSRTGSSMSRTTLNGFWSSVATAAFDPKVLYDPFGQRWIFTACDAARSANSAVLIGVSQTTDPTGTWNLFKVDADSGNVAWADYPSLGFNKDWIVVNMNMFAVSNDAFQGAAFWVFKKADLYANVGATHTRIYNTTIGGTIVPAITYDNTLDKIYLAQTYNGNSSGQGYHRLFTISGAVGSETLTAGGFLVHADEWSDYPGSADFAPQMGSSRKIQNNDSRTQNLVYRNGKLWFAHTVFLPASAPTRSAVQWVQATPAANIADGGTVNQFGRIDDGTGNLFYAFPAIAVNRLDDALVGYTRFGAGQFPSANYAFRAGSDAASTMRGEVTLKGGEAKYDKDYGSGRNRWGDYSSAVVDPTNDVDLWTVLEYAAAPSSGIDRWGTWWGRVTLSNRPPTLDPVEDVVFGRDAGPQTLPLTGITAGGESGQTVSITASASSSTIVQSLSVDAVSGSTSTLRFTPASNESGSATISLTLVDNGGTADGGQNTTVASFQVVVDEPPVGKEDEYDYEAGSELSVDEEDGVLANDLDTDDDVDELRALLVDDVNNGTLELDDDGSFTYTPDEGFDGVETFEYQVSDGFVTSDPVTVTLSVAKEKESKGLFGCRAALARPGAVTARGTLAAILAGISLAAMRSRRRHR